MVQKRFLNCLICCFIFLVCLFTTACSNNDNNSNETTLSGSAIKGIISNGIVSAYNLAGQDKILLTQSRTNQLGQFSLTIPKENTNQLILLELSTDNKTRMRCDLTLGCIDQNSGQLIRFGNHVSLPSFFKLFGIAGSHAQTSQNTFISPLTHLVVATAKDLDDTLTSNSINIASDWVENALSLDTSPMLVQLKDITNLSNLSVMSNEELKQSIISAAMYSETIESSWSSGSGSIDSINIKNILSRASNLTNDLSSILTESENANYQASPLNRIQSQLDAQLDELTSSEIVILTQPSSVSVTETHRFNLYAQVNSELDLSYQWYKNGDAILGANSAVYSKPNSELNDAGVYELLISDGFSELTSLSASVTINKLSNGLDITQQPQSLSVTEGEPILLTVDVNNDSSVNYQWQKNGSIIPGAMQSTYFIANSQLKDEGNYRVTISNNEKQISSNFVNVWVSESIEAVSINTHPQSKTILEGQSVVFNVKATGDGFLRYQWRKNGTPIDNEFLASLKISSASKLNEGNYDVVVTNSQGGAYSKAATLTVLSTIPPVRISQHPQTKSVTIGQTFTLSVSASGGEPLNYQWYFNGDAIENAISPNFRIVSASLDNEGSYSVLVNNENSSQQSETSFVSVNLPTLKSLELTWDTPTKREDGSALGFDEIMGYLIEYGDKAYALENSIMVENQLPNSLVLNNLSAGELLLRIATIDSDNNQGAFSDTIRVSLQ